MAQEKTTTMADGTVSKVTALPGGCTLALFDSSGGVSKIDAQKFMELVRGSIQIGGRNLLPNSKQISAGPNSSKYYHKIISDAFEVKAGQLFTASFGAVELTGTQSQNFQVSIADRAKDVTLAKFILGPDIKTVTATASADCDNAYALLYAGIQGDAADKGIKVTELKLERGNIATDWTPAPEDFGGGVKSPYTQSVTRLYLQQQLKPLTIQRKGGRHERRQNNGADKRDSERTHDGRISGQMPIDCRYERLHSPCRNLSNITVNTESTGRRVPVRSCRNRQMHMGWHPIPQRNIRFRLRRVSVSSVLGRYHRLEALDEYSDAGINLTPGKEVVAA